MVATTLRAHAEKFSVAVFQNNMRDFLQKVGIQVTSYPEGPLLSNMLEHSIASASRTMAPRVSTLEIASVTGATIKQHKE